MLNVKKLSLRLDFDFIPSYLFIPDKNYGLLTDQGFCFGQIKGISSQRGLSSTEQVLGEKRYGEKIWTLQFYTIITDG